MAFHLPYLEWFKQKGYETHVCARNDYEKKEDCRIPFCDRYYDLPFKRSPVNVKNIGVSRELKRIINANGYDIIHCHTPMGGVLTRLAAGEARASGTKLIYTAHGFHFYRGAPLKNWLFYYPAEKFLARYTDVLITINKEDYHAAQKFKAKSVLYVPGVGVDVQRFSNVVIDKGAKREELGIPGGAFAVLSVGELIKRKNHEAVLKALARLNRKEIIYVLCGDGELGESLRSKAAELNVETRFLGFRKDIPEICAAMDLFVFPSYQEGLPVALMEAMASGLPVVCSDIRGNRELIEKGRGGYLVQPEDTEGLAEGIAKLMAHPALRVSMGEINQEEARKYDRDIVQEVMEEIYSGVHQERGDD